MIKGYKFIVSEEEKNRIISVHENRTKQQYLTETTKQDIYSQIKNLGFKSVNEFMDSYLKKFPSSTQTPSGNVNTTTTITQAPTVSNNTTTTKTQAPTSNSEQEQL